MHGTETEISNGVGKGYSLRMTLDDINDLERKPVQRLILLQCRAGNIGKSAGFGWRYPKERKTNGCGTGTWQVNPRVKRSDTVNLFRRL